MRLAQQSGFEHRLGQLFDEQRDAVGAVDNGPRYRLGHLAAAGDLADQVGALLAAQAVQRQSRHMAVASPWVLELRPTSHQQHHAPLADRLDHRFDQLTRGRVDPVGIFHQHQHRSAPRQGGELIRQSTQGPHLAQFRSHRQSRVAVSGRDRQQIGKQRHVRVGLCL